MSQDTNQGDRVVPLWSVADLLRGDFKQSQYGAFFYPLPNEQGEANLQLGHS